MLEFLEPHISEAISFFAGATCGSLLTLRITRRQRLSNSTLADQRRAQAGGDVVGRDKVTGAAARPRRDV
jgi:hypothetical protein